jgi:cytochrome P450
LAFGMGIHRCLGRSVARAIVPIATDAILDALPHLRESTFRVSGSPVPGVFRGPTSMSVIHPTVDSGVWHPSDVAVEEREA